MSLAPGALPGGSAPDYRAIVRQAGPAVVAITVAGLQQTAPGEPPSGPAADLPSPRLREPVDHPGRLPRGTLPFRTQGSGFIISSDGLILTNAHVVLDASHVSVQLSDRRVYTARVLGADSVTDVAVLRIRADNLTVVRLGDARQLQVGDPVLAIGSPFGFEQTATQGIVSAKGRALPGDAAVPFIQTDVAVNPGNSGGPLFDGGGAVVGINAQIYSQSGGYQGLSFAIPINVALRVKDQIVATGRASHGRLGATLQDLNQTLAASFGLQRPDGALVARVAAGSPAASAGLLAGDVITRVDHEPVLRVGDLSAHIGISVPGTVLQLQVWRAGGPQRLDVRLGEAGADPQQAEVSGPALPPGQIGLQLRVLTAAERARLQVDGGLVVESVTAPAGSLGLNPGDVLLAVNGVAVGSVGQLRAVVATKPPALALLVDRGGDRMYIPVEPN